MPGKQLTEWDTRLLLKYGSNQVRVAISPCYQTIDVTALSTPAPFATRRQKEFSRAQNVSARLEANKVDFGLLIDMDFFDTAPDSSLDPVAFLTDSYSDSEKLTNYIGGML